MEFTLIGKDAGIYNYIEREYDGRHGKLLCYFNGRIYWGSSVNKFCKKKVYDTSMNEEGYKTYYKVGIEDGVTLFEIHQIHGKREFHNTSSIEEAKKWMEAKIQEIIPYDNFVRFMQEMYPNRYYVIVDRIQSLNNTKKIFVNPSTIRGFGRLDKKDWKGEIYFSNRRFELSIDENVFNKDTMEGVSVTGIPEARIISIKKSYPHQDSLYSVEAAIQKKDLEKIYRRMKNELSIIV